MNKQQIKKERKMFLEDLPRKGKIIDWENCKGKLIKFIYDNIEGYIIIKYFNKKTQYITIIYKEKEYEIYSSNFKKCALGSMIGKYTSDYKIEIGTNLKDEKHDIIITDKKKKGNFKYYKYHCNKCGFNCEEHYKNQEYKNELWIEESNLLKGQGCSCCCSSPQIVVEDINSIYKTDSWMIPYIGEECAKTHTCNSNDEIQVTCPDCGRIKKNKMRISTIYQNHSIGCSCSDSLPYGEKLMFSVIEQLKIQFLTQLTKDTFKWCNKYKYDFYFEIDKTKYIIETNGRQHYEDVWDKLEVTQENDRLKKKLALENGIKEENYIVIDCRKSELEWIKNSILESNLNKLFDLSKIDWIKCEEFALSNRVKEACNYWNSGIKNAINIGRLMKLSDVTITKYLQKGKILNWCNSYDSKEILSERSKKLGLLNGKQVEIFKDGISLGIFPSCAELERQSLELFGVKLNKSHISNVCVGKRKQHQGYIFRYVEEV